MQDYFLSYVHGTCVLATSSHCQIICTHIKERAIWQCETSNNPYSLQACPTFSSKDLQINPKIGTCTETHLEYVHKHMPERF